MKLTFLGAAGEVTGSQHLIETENLRILLDCGFFQGRRAESRKKNAQFHCDPANLDAVILSHAHSDHCGNIPRLYREGFRGSIFCTDATADVVSSGERRHRGPKLRRPVVHSEHIEGAESRRPLVKACN